MAKSLGADLGEETDVFADAGYVGIAKREETKGIRAQWPVGHVPGQAPLAGHRHPIGPGTGSARANQGKNPCQGRASVSGNQTPVWSCEGALPGLDEKHAAALYVVCALEPVDGAKSSFEQGGINPPGVRPMAHASPKKGSIESKRAFVGALIGNPSACRTV